MNLYEKRKRKYFITFCIIIGLVILIAIFSNIPYPFSFKYNLPDKGKILKVTGNCFLIEEDSSKKLELKFLR